MAQPDETSVGQLYPAINISGSANVQLGDRYYYNQPQDVDTTILERLCESLSFPEMYSRYENIEEHHSRTFEWILSNPAASKSLDDASDDDSRSFKVDNVAMSNGAGSSIEDADGSDSDSDSDMEAEVQDFENEADDANHGVEEDSGDQSTNDASDDNEDYEASYDNSTVEWDSFVDWLEHGHGIYWVSGKPGSGKSTLVKYLVDTLSQNLEVTDTQAPKMIVLSFWFWEAGSQIQNSMLGCLRSLLRQLVLSLTKDQTKEVFDRYKLLFNNKYDWDWTRARLTNALKELFEIPTLRHSTVVICLDGLDESKEGPDVLNYLECQIQPLSNFRLCVSSRPEPFYTDHLSGCRKLSLQDLNRRDIDQVIDEKFFMDPKVARFFHKDPDAKFRLRASLQTKARGVFLWVRLAIKDLLRGVTNRDDWKILETRLGALPDDLNRLYTVMLSRNYGDMKTYEQEAALYFRLILCEETHILEFALMLNDTYRRQLLQVNHCPTSNDLEENLWLHDIETWINARSGCLLEVKTDGIIDLWPTNVLETPCYGLQSLLKRYEGYSVAFIHRTARTYLISTKEGQKLIDSCTLTDNELLEKRFESWLAHTYVLHAFTGHLIGYHIDPDMPCDRSDVLCDCAKTLWNKLYEQGLIYTDSTRHLNYYQRVRINQTLFLSKDLHRKDKILEADFRRPFPICSTGIDFCRLCAHFGWFNQAYRLLPTELRHLYPSSLLDIVKNACCALNDPSLTSKGISEIEPPRLIEFLNCVISGSLDEPHLGETIASAVIEILGGRWTLLTERLDSSIRSRVEAYILDHRSVPPLHSLHSSWSSGRLIDMGLDLSRADIATDDVLSIFTSHITQHPLDRILIETRYVNTSLGPTTRVYTVSKKQSRIILSQVLAITDFRNINRGTNSEIPWLYHDDFPQLPAAESFFGSAAEAFLSLGKSWDEIQDFAQLEEVERSRTNEWAEVVCWKKWFFGSGPPYDFPPALTDFAENYAELTFEGLPLSKKCKPELLRERKPAPCTRCIGLIDEID